MPYEYAAYFKVLLLCGYDGELQRYVDAALEEQDPLSDVILELAAAGSDGNRRLSVLNACLEQAKASGAQEDNAAFALAASFLKRKAKDGMPMQELAQLMYRFALDEERYLTEPWDTMYLLSDHYDGVVDGWYDKETYLREFDAFLKWADTVNFLNGHPQ